MSYWTELIFLSRYTIFDRTQLLNKAKEAKPWNKTASEYERAKWWKSVAYYKIGLWWKIPCKLSGVWRSCCWLRASQASGVFISVYCTYHNIAYFPEKNQ
jgi:hypothetical protein